MLKQLLLLALSWPIACAFAQTDWLTIMGDPANPAADTIQVNPIPLSVAGDFRTMRVRVSRAAQRTNWDGIPYRSYESSVLFDCASSTARYLEISYYPQPTWLGEIRQTVNYPLYEMPRWMLFREIEPNPNQRIIHAACGAMGRR